MTSYDSSPQLARRRLGLELRKLRTAAYLDLRQVADMLEMSTSTISRIEKGQARARTGELRYLLETLRVPAESAEGRELLELARSGRRTHWAEDAAASFLNDQEKVFVQYESAAHRCRLFASLVVPVLLQTPTYAQRCLRLIKPELSKNDRSVPSIVEHRQESLYRSDPLLLDVILEEGCLVRQVGTQSDLIEQLKKLFEVTDHDNVTVRVLPRSGPAHPAMLSSWHHLEFYNDMDPDIVYVETGRGSSILESVDEVNRYLAWFDELTAQSLDEDESRACIKEAEAYVTEWQKP